MPLEPESGEIPPPPSPCCCTTVRRTSGRYGHHVIHWTAILCRARGGNKCCWSTTSAAMIYEQGTGAVPVPVTWTIRGWLACWAQPETDRPPRLASSLPFCTPAKACCRRPRRPENGIVHSGLSHKASSMAFCVRPSRLGRLLFDNDACLYACGLEGEGFSALSHSLRASTETTTQREGAATIVTGEGCHQRGDTSWAHQREGHDGRPPGRHSGVTGTHALGRRHPFPPQLGSVCKAGDEVPQERDRTASGLNMGGGQMGWIGATVRPPQAAGCRSGQSPPSPAPKGSPRVLND